MLISYYPSTATIRSVSRLLAILEPDCLPVDSHTRLMKATGMFLTRSRLFRRISCIPPRFWPLFIHQPTRPYGRKMAPLPEPNREPPKHEMKYFPNMTTALPSESGEFRRVLHTGLYSQVVLMTVPVGGDIGDEVGGKFPIPSMVVN